MARPRRPIVPPTGFYDPALDAQGRAAGRGLEYLEQDTELAGARAAQDYTFGVEDLTRGRDRGLFDLTRSRDRGFEDLDTTLNRGREDYDRDVMMLNRSYTQLARRQAEGARAAGVLSGGLAMQAAAIRAENQAIDRQPLDTSFARLGEDVGRSRTRLGEDFATQSGRIGEDFETGRGRLTVDYNRGVTDRATALSRGRRENTEFGLDLDAQRLYQAGQAGWVPPRVGGGGGSGGGGPRIYGFGESNPGLAAGVQNVQGNMPVMAPTGPGGAWRPTYPGAFQPSWRRRR